MILILCRSPSVHSWTTSSHRWTVSTSLRGRERRCGKHSYCRTLAYGFAFVLVMEFFVTVCKYRWKVLIIRVSTCPPSPPPLPTGYLITPSLPGGPSRFGVDYDIVTRHPSVTSCLHSNTMETPNAGITLIIYRVVCFIWSVLPIFSKQLMWS